MSRRTKPPNTDERILAGKVLIDPHAIKGLNIEPEDIQDGKCRRVVATVQRLHVQGRIPDNGNLGTGWLQQIEDEGGGTLETLSGFLDEAVTADNIAYSARKVMVAATWRRIQQEAEDGQEPEKIQALLGNLKAPTEMRLPIKPKADFIMEECEHKTPILGPHLTERSMGLIYSWRGLGKTMFALSQFDSISKGTALGPWKVANPVPSLFIDGELAEADLQERFTLLDRLNPAPEVAPLYVLSSHTCNRIGLGNLNLSKPETMEQLKAVCLDLRVKVLAIDNISSLYPGTDENPKLEWDPINQWALDLRFSGISTVFIHHEGYESRQRGTSGREDNLDYSIRLIRPNGYTPDEGCRFIAHFTKSRVRSSELPLIADTEFWLTEQDEHPTWVWGDVRKQSRKDILRLLDEGLSQADVARSLNVDKAYVSRIRKEAIRDKLLTSQNTLTQSGWEQLKMGGI